MCRKIIIILVFGLWGVVVGCQGGGASNEKPRDPDPHAMPAPAGESDAAAYYYFTSAQLKLKDGEVSEALRLLEMAARYDTRSPDLKLNLAELYLIQKDTKTALQLIQRVLKTQPDNTEALVLAGRIYQQQEASAQARTYFERALATKPSDPNVYLYLGRIYWNDSDLANAERIFHRMVLEFPSYYAAYYFRGKVLTAQGKSKEAEAAFTRSLELEPSLEEPRFELIKIYRRQNRPIRIIQMYRSILSYNPDNFKAAFELAVCYRQNGHADQGMPLLAELGRRSSEDGGILSYLYENYLEPKQYQLAAWVISGMLKGAPGSSELHYMVGVAYDGLKVFPKALEHLTQVSHESKFYKNAVVYRALLLRNTSNLDQSIEVMKEALKYDPNNADYYLYMGTFYEERRQYAKALDILARGLIVDDKNVRIHFRMGVVHDKAGHKQDAIAAMKEVLALQPEDAEALNYLGYTYADLGIHLDEAENLIQSALKMNPDDGYINDSMAWVYYKQGRYEKALEWLTKAEKLVPDDAVILEHLGDVHLKLDRREKALKYYQRSMKAKETDRGQLEQKIRTLNHEPMQPNP